MRRRRTRGTWFPSLGTASGDVEGFNISGRRFGFDLANDGGCTVVISPVTFDQPVEGELGTDAHISDILGQEYVLQRIVGKFFINRLQAFKEDIGGLQADSGIAVLAGAGFFVARAQDIDTGDAEQPIGSNTPAERNDNYNPLDVDCIREPWIWRRTWILGSALQADSFAAGQPGAPFASSTQMSGTRIGAFFPASSALYQSVADGPHIDSKVKRRVRQDERLFFVVAAALYPPADRALENTTTSITAYLDYRMFGSLRKAQNKSSF